MKTPVVKRSIVVARRNTSVNLEEAFWTALKEIARARETTLSDLVAAIDSERQYGNLSSAIRVFVLSLYRDQIAELEKRRRTREMLTNAAVPIAPKEAH